MEVDRQKAKKKDYKEKLRKSEEEVQSLLYELKTVREERDRMIGEKCLATAKYKELEEELVGLQNRYFSLESNFISQKVELANLKSSNESLREDFEMVKKMMVIRDKEIQALSKQNDNRRKPNPETPTRGKDMLRPPQFNNNIRPFPSTSFSFNLISSKQNSFASSFRDDDH